jgi:histone H2A
MLNPQSKLSQDTKGPAAGKGKTGKGKVGHGLFGGKQGGRGRKGGGKNVYRSKRAGLTFPVGRMARFLRNGRYAKRLGGGAPIYMAAVIEYLTAEVLELAGNATRDNKKSRIIPRHIQLAVRNDDELAKLLGDVTIAQGGVLPNINAVLLPIKKAPKAPEEEAAPSAKTKTKIKEKAGKEPKKDKHKAAKAPKSSHKDTEGGKAAKPKAKDDDFEEDKGKKASKGSKPSSSDSMEY